MGVISGIFGAFGRLIKLVIYIAGTILILFSLWRDIQEGSLGWFLADAVLPPVGVIHGIYYLFPHWFPQQIAQLLHP